MKLLKYLFLATQTVFPEKPSINQTVLLDFGPQIISVINY